MTDENKPSLVPILGATAATLLILNAFRIKVTDKALYQKELADYQNNSQIKSIDSNDFNNDGINDITVTLGENTKKTYFGTQEGKYLTAEQIKQTEIERIEQGYQKQLRETNEYFKKAYCEPNLAEEDR